jgi:hypothetical protein
MEILEHQALTRARRERICTHIARKLKLQTTAQDVLRYRVVENETFPFISHTLGISIDHAQKIMRRITARLLRSGEGGCRQELLR